MKYFSSRLFIRYQITVRQTNKLEYLQKLPVHPLGPFSSKQREKSTPCLPEYGYKQISHIQFVTGILFISAQQNIVRHHLLLKSSSMKLGSGYWL